MITLQKNSENNFQKASMVNDESDESDRVVDPSEDYYDTILSQRLEESRRSRYEGDRLMRGLSKYDER